MSTKSTESDSSPALRQKSRWSAFGLGLLSGFLLLPLLLALWLYWLIQLDNHQSWIKSQLARSFEQLTGLNLHIGQTIELQVSHHPGLQTSEIAIKDQAVTVLTAKDVRLKPADFSSQDLKIDVSMDTLHTIAGSVRDLSGLLTISDQNVLAGEGRLRFEDVDALFLYQTVMQHMLHQTPVSFSHQIDVFSEISGTLSWRFSDDLFELNNIDLHIDQSHLKGQVSYDTDSGHIGLDLQIDRVKIDPYLKFAQQFSSDTTPANKEDIVQSTLEQVRGINASGKTTIGLLEYQETRLEDISLSFAE